MKCSWWIHKFTSVHRTGKIDCLIFKKEKKRQFPYQRMTVTRKGQRGGREWIRVESATACKFSSVLRFLGQFGTLCFSVDQQLWSVTSTATSGEVSRILSSFQRETSSSSSSSAVRSWRRWGWIVGRRRGFLSGTCGSVSLRVSGSARAVNNIPSSTPESSLIVLFGFENRSLHSSCALLNTDLSGIAGLTKLQHDVSMCKFDDVHMMWETPNRPGRTEKRSFWTPFDWVRFAPCLCH